MDLVVWIDMAFNGGLAEGHVQDQYDAEHGRPTKAAPPAEGEAAETVQADCAGGEGDRAEQADPEVEAPATAAYHAFPSRSSLRSTSIHEKMSSKSTMLLS